MYDPTTKCPPFTPFLTNHRTANQSLVERSVDVKIALHVCWYVGTTEETLTQSRVKTNKTVQQLVGCFVIKSS